MGRHLAADYTIIMSRTLKVTGNHVVYDCGAWFYKGSYVKLAYFVFLADVYIFTRLETNYQPHLLSWQFLFRSASADNPYLDLDYSGYHKHLIQLWYNIDQVESFSPTLAGGSYRPSITRMGSMIISLRLQFHVQAVLCPP